MAFLPYRGIMSTEYERKRDRRLRKAGVRHFDKLIHEQDRAWLVENFAEGAPKYPVNVAKLMRNIIWQTRERVVSGDRESRDQSCRSRRA